MLDDQGCDVCDPFRNGFLDLMYGGWLKQECISLVARVATATRFYLDHSEAVSSSQVVNREAVGLDSKDTRLIDLGSLRKHFAHRLPGSGQGSLARKFDAADWIVSWSSPSIAYPRLAPTRQLRHKSKRRKLEDNYIYVTTS